MLITENSLSKYTATKLGKSTVHFENKQFSGTGSTRGATIELVTSFKYHEIGECLDANVTSVEIVGDVKCVGGICGFYVDVECQEYDTCEGWAEIDLDSLNGKITFEQCEVPITNMWYR